MKRFLSLALCFLLLLTCAAADSAVTAAQERLLELGYEIGAADGILGAKTASALRLVQTLLLDAGHDVSPTGSADDATLRLLQDPQQETLLRTLLRGSWGARVKAAQQRLASLNLLRDAADGHYGANTEAAVSAFEAWAAENGLSVTPDARLDPDEYDLLFSDLSALGFEAPIYYRESEELKPAHIYAKNAILIDAVSGGALFEKQADEPAEPASTTKIVTLITALSLCDPDEKIVIPDAALDVPADSSLVPVLPGETMTMRDLLYALIIRSGNDAANAAAVLCSGSVEAFVDRMNDTAAGLGMANTHFSNPHGYAAPDHLTTARDLATAARYGMTQEEFRRIVTCYQYTLPATQRRDALTLQVKWELLDSSSPYYIPHAAGIKSGYTSSAGFCYVGAYQEDDITLIAVVLGGRTRNMAWTDLKHLFSYGMKQMKGPLD